MPRSCQAQTGATALMLAVDEGRTDIVRMLLDGGADMDVVCDVRSTVYLRRIQPFISFYMDLYLNIFDITGCRFCLSGVKDFERTCCVYV